MHLKFFSRTIFRRHGEFDNPVRNPDCGELEVDNWVISQFILDRLAPVVGVRPFPLHEQMLMVAAVCSMKPSHIFEWGTHIGKSARIFYEISKAFGIGVKIHSVDLPDSVEHVEHPQSARGQLVKGLTDVALHLGDGLDTSLKLYEKCRGERCRALFFLDGDHSYASVRRELEGIISAAPDSAILVHDTFYQTPEANYNIGPFQAIEDVLSQVPETYQKIASGMGLPGMTLIRKRPISPKSLKRTQEK